MADTNTQARTGQKTDDDSKEIERALAQAARAQKTSASADAKHAKAKETLKTAKTRLRDAEKNLKLTERAQSGEEATRDQAVYAAAQKGATVPQIVERTGLTAPKVRKIVASGPFGSRRSRTS